MADTRRLFRPLVIAPVIALSGLAAGCGDRDGVNSYRVPREASGKDSGQSNPAQGLTAYRVDFRGPGGKGGMAGPAARDSKGEVRLLGAIIPAGREGSYTVKLLGPAENVDAVAGAFDTFLKSIRPTGNAVKPLAWEMPPGGREVPLRPNQLRLVTYALGAEGRTVEVAIYPPFGGDLLQNVNRWRTLDIGLPEVGETELPAVVKVLKLGTPAKGQ